MDWTKVADINFLHFLHEKRGTTVDGQLDEFIKFAVAELYRREFKFSHHMKRKEGEFAYSVYYNGHREVCIGYNGKAFQFSTKLLSNQQPS